MFGNTLSETSIQRPAVITVFKNLRSNRSGATSIEYALIASIVSMVIIASLQSMGPTLVQIFQNILSGF